ncbi:hypothetical protein OCS_05836 [Ophiocordyceps sinensis CO18]|uniref:Interferon-induced 6-16 n=1 Tax=Ophiocordyceps sinensis (strain Co18 / CGMCC 3.14243) TaxID=911162 RepID=T4ZZ77_OPHSC|nr:hypothetical protein OCS_05836 [Ophiocordyceps sinensis CO18]
MRFPESLANWTEKAGQFAARHADVVGAAAPGLLILAAPVLVAGPLLGVVGFGAAGISAGSAAAVAQSAAMGGGVCGLAKGQGW